MKCLVRLVKFWVIELGENMRISFFFIGGKGDERCFCFRGSGKSRVIVYIGFDKFCCLEIKGV